MTRLALALVALTLVSSPLSAQTLTVLLPSINFPTGTLTPSTKGCGSDAIKTAVCVLQE